MSRSSFDVRGREVLEVDLLTLLPPFSIACFSFCLSLEAFDFGLPLTLSLETLTDFFVDNISLAIDTSESLFVDNSLDDDDKVLSSSLSKQIE